MPSDGAMGWMAANWLGPEARAGSGMTRARVTRGAISFIGAVEPRARLLGHATCHVSRSSTASTIKLGVHATIIPSKKAWVSSMTCLL